MEIVGVKSTVGRAVKCVDPGKTTRSESAWLGYSLCEYHIHIYIYIVSHTPRYIYIFMCDTLQRRTKVGGSKRIRYPRRPIVYIKRWALIRTKYKILFYML